MRSIAKTIPEMAEIAIEQEMELVSDSILNAEASTIAEVRRERYASYRDRLEAVEFCLWDDGYAGDCRQTAFFLVLHEMRERRSRGESY